MICRKWVRVLLYLQRDCRRIIYLDSLSGMSIHSFAQDDVLGFILLSCCRNVWELRLHVLGLHSRPASQAS